MNSQEAKTILLQYFLFQKNHVAAFTESFFQSDILTVNRSDYSTEVEIKTRREDLLNELHTINLAWNGMNGEKLRQRQVKFDKHSRFFGKLLVEDLQPIPNSFYIAIPEELYDHRLNSLSQYPYGLMVIDKYNHIEIKKEAIKLHNNKIDRYSMWKLVQKSSYENYFLRKKLITLKGGEAFENLNEST